MNLIDPTVFASCYLDTAAWLILVMMLILERSSRKLKNPALHVFRVLCMTLTVYCIMSMTCHFLVKKPTVWCHYLALASRTLKEWLAFLSVLLWVRYMEKKMYGDRKPGSMVRAVYRFPFLVFTLLLTVNLFHGVVFTCTVENRYKFTDLYYFFTFVEMLYFVGSVFWLHFYNRRAEKICFLRVLPMTLPVVAGTAVEYFFSCEADVLGFATGALLAYLSMAEEIHYLDHESGLYNPSFLSYLFDLAMAGKYDARSALVLETKGDYPERFDILYGTLNQGDDVIRVENHRFLMFSGERNRSALQILMTRLDEAVEKHNTDHPEEKIQISARCFMRSDTEDALEFLRSVRDDKEAGDEVRGVVSMISELDRLDNELKLAADMQAYVLPMDFPPFPDRTEFGLYASMTPAKEVGGDFYDFFLIDKDHLALVIADVSGKGIPAALFMMMSRTLIKNQLLTGCDPATALKRVNQQVCECNPSSMFVTVWLAVIELSTGKGLACNAGHEDPAYRRENGKFEMSKYKHNLLVGIMKKAGYVNREFELHAGDCIFVYTDGVMEATDAAGKMFGEERLVSALNRQADAKPEDLIRHVHDAVDHFVDSAPQFDDITMLCFKYYGNEL